MLKWFREGLGPGHTGAGGLLGALDGLFNPGAARAREHLAAENESVMQAPTPGDMLLRDGKLVITAEAARTVPRNRRTR